MTLLSVYIAAAILGVGVTVIDLLGLFGGESGEDGDADADGDLIEADVDTDVDADGDADFDADGDGNADSAADWDDTGPTPSAVGHDAAHKRSPGRRPRRRRDWALAVLSGVRNLVYFALGFGPVGLFALSQVSDTRSLVWSLPAGAVSLVGGRLLRRFLRKELNSEIATHELLMESGKVIVGIGPGALGKVRISYSGAYVDRYARASDPQRALPVGTAIRVSDIGDDCVYVEAEEGGPPAAAEREN